MTYIKHLGNDLCPRRTPEIRVSLLAPCMYVQGWEREG